MNVCDLQGQLTCTRGQSIFCIFIPELQNLFFSKPHFKTFSRHKLVRNLYPFIPYEYRIFLRNTVHVFKQMELPVGSPEQNIG